MPERCPCLGCLGASSLQPAAPTLPACLQPDHIEKGYCPRIPCERLPASYINHYICNEGAVIPKYGGKASDTDQAAVDVLQKAPGPDRKVTTPPPGMTSSGYLTMTQMMCARCDIP